MLGSGEVSERGDGRGEEISEDGSQQSLGQAWERRESPSELRKGTQVQSCAGKTWPQPVARRRLED